MKDFDICYKDGNHRILSALNILDVLAYLADEPRRDNQEIIKIQERKKENDKEK